ncbi:MAG: hypothetical protein ACRCXT_00685 [Paraclostridium sp.]
MNLPNGTTMNGHELLTTINIPNRVYFTPKYKGTGGQYANIAIIHLNLTSSRTEFCNQWEINCKSISHSLKSIDLRFVFTHIRTNNTDTFSCNVTSLNSKYIDSSNVKIIIQSGLCRIYVKQDTVNNICRVDVNNITYSNADIYNDDRILEPTFPSSTSLISNPPESERTVNVYFSNNTNLTSFITKQSTQTIDSSNITTINFDKQITGNFNGTTVVSSGIYKLSVQIGLKGAYSSSKTDGLIRIMNGSTVLQESFFNQADLRTSIIKKIEISCIVQLSANDVIGCQVQLLSNTGSITVVNTHCLLAIEEVH